MRERGELRAAKVEDGEDSEETTRVREAERKEDEDDGTSRHRIETRVANGGG